MHLLIVPPGQPIIITPKHDGSHNRALLRDLKAPYTFVLKRYMKRMASDYVRNKLCLGLIVIRTFEKDPKVSRHLW